MCFFCKIRVNTVSLEPTNKLIMKSQVYSFRASLPNGMKGTEYVNGLQNNNKILTGVLIAVSIAFTGLVAYQLLSKPPKFAVNDIGNGERT